MRAAVVGAGAWGTALANVLAENGHEVRLWAFERDVVESIASRRENGAFLPGVALHHGLAVTGDLLAAVVGAELVVFATPSQVLRSVARRAAAGIGPAATVAVASKGIEEGSLALMSDVVATEIPQRAVAALSGPSFAAEVAAHQPTAVVAASSDATAARLVQSAFSNGVLRVYTSTDVIGVELGGALKNVMAVASGIADGLALGANTRAALITRGLAEMTRLGAALGANPATFAGLAGLGDLVLTCTGALSRNRAVGLAIGEGQSLEAYLAERQTVAEGVATARSAHALATREGIEMPIVAMVFRILFAGHDPQEALSALMSRELRSEQDR